MGIDPMCGAGTIPRVIIGMGGACDAIDIDPHQYAITKQELPSNASVKLGDCMRLPAPVRRYDYVYTSIPFEWFNDYLHDIPRGLARSFRRLLRPGGILLIDTDDVTERDGRSWQFAKTQITYFVANGFRFDESRRFVTQFQSQDRDAAFTQLKFTVT